MIPWPDTEPMHEGRRVDDGCCNEGGKRADGSTCMDDAGSSGWCSRCLADVLKRDP